MRRPSGVYVARLVVPPRHRQVLGKRELIASTGTRVLAIARIVGGEILARWRRRLHDLDLLGSNMNVLQVAAGSPALLQEGYLPLREAGEKSGIGEEHLLRSAAEGRLDLYVRLAGVEGYFVRESELDRDHEESKNPYIIPTAEQLAGEHREQAIGACRVRGPEDIATLLQQQDAVQLLAVDVLTVPGTVFIPFKALYVRRVALEVATLQVDRVRRQLATSITPGQIERATAQEQLERSARSLGEKAHRRLSEAVSVYFDETGASASKDQIRRKRAACDLLVELEGDPRLHELTRDRLKIFQSKKLPTVPERENKVRLQFRTTSVSESIAAVAGTGWECISAAERHKRMTWICGLFSWLKEEKWLNDDPAQGLNARRRTAKKDGKPGSSKRRPFTPDELNQMFAHDWFADGRGELTAVGTYREWQPYYYWLPLCGLYTGARIRELCQLSLGDLRKTADGVWIFDINDQGSDHADDFAKSLKNQQSHRRIPVHQKLIDLGLLRWHKALVEAGRYTRLFPELTHDSVKGYGKSATKWFSSFLKNKLNWERDSTRTFHSFRHTLVTETINRLDAPEHVVAQITGHKRGTSVLMGTYKHDKLPGDLKELTSRINFDLPPIGQFDVDAGLKALQDALARKRK